MGTDKRATIINKETKIIFKVKMLLFILFEINFFTLSSCIINSVWAANSNKINPSRTKRLKNLYKSFSKWIPKKIEWAIKNIAEIVPK